MSQPAKRELFLFLFRATGARFGVRAALLLALLLSVTLAIVAATAAARGRSAALVIVGLTAEVLAWGPGMLLAFTVGLRALAIDSETGLLSLPLSRGVSRRDFVLARIAALAAWLVIATVLGAFIVMVAAASSARGAALSLELLQTGLAASLQCLAFSAVMAALVFATLAPRSRGRGYLTLVLALAGPELLRVALLGLAPAEPLAQAMAIPSAFSALRRGLSPGSVDVALVLTAAAALGVVVVVAITAARHSAGTALRVFREPRP